LDRASILLCFVVVGAALVGCESQRGGLPNGADSEATSTEDGIRPQIERNWNISAGDEECPIEQQEPVELRLRLDADGTVTKVEPITDVSKDKCLWRTYDSARRAVMISSPLKLPPGKSYPTMTIRFSPAEAVQ
jgi:hypothetical protein